MQKAGIYIPDKKQMALTTSFRLASSGGWLIGSARSTGWHPAFLRGESADWALAVRASFMCISMKYMLFSLREIRRMHVFTACLCYNKTNIVIDSSRTYLIKL